MSGILMNEKLIVRVSEESGLPYVMVSGRDLWNFVEYLSRRRDRVSYGYCDNDFTVVFLQCDRHAVQTLLDDWAALYPHEPTCDVPLAHASA